MEINEIIDLSRSLLRQGDTGKALESLRGFLEKDPRYSEMVRTLEVMEANFNAARQQEIKGILSFQEAQRQYSQVNDALFSALDDLASGRALQQRVSSPAPSSSGTNRLVWFVGGAAVLILGLLAGIWFSRKGARRAGETPKQEAVTCPNFNDPGLRVIILPFQSLTSSVAKPELTIQSRIRELSGSNKFPVAIEVLNTYDSEKNPPDKFSASRIGRDCQADLVVWGLYDNKPDSIKVDIQYVFTKSGELGKTPGFLAFKDLPALRDGHMLLRGLDDAIFSICALMAVQAKEGPLALKWFEKIHNQESAEKTMLARLHELQDKVDEKRVLNLKKN